MRRRASLLLIVAWLGPCSTAQTADIPDLDFRTKCEGRKWGNYATAVCVAREEIAVQDLSAKWGKLPSEIQQHCSTIDNPTYQFIANCVITDLIDLKDKKGLCKGYCGPDPELDPLFPESQFNDPDVAPLPLWDSRAGCSASLKEFEMDADVAICVSDESLAKVRLALFWKKLKGALRYDCLQSVGSLKSYDLLGSCIKARTGIATDDVGSPP